YIDAVYPSAASSNTGLPQFAARLSDRSLLLGPAPDQPYGLEVYGTQRPTPLSSANTTTWISQNLPELFIGASMVFSAGFQRDFGAQSETPQMGGSWESQYQTLLKNVNVAEHRKKYQAEGWSNTQPSPVATPARV